MLVMYVHDVSDIFVDVLKMVNYLKLEGRAGWYASELAYVATVVAWVYYRLWEFPMRVTASSFSVAWRLFARPEWTFSWFDFVTGAYHAHMPYYAPLNICMFALQAMHVYWFYLLANVGYRIATESAREASRREYEGDSDGEEEGEEEGGKAGKSAPPSAGAGAGGGQRPAGAEGKDARPVIQVPRRRRN
jgi:ceramide synthetase